MNKLLLTLTLLLSSFLISCQTTSLTQVGNSTYRFYHAYFGYSTQVEKCEIAADGKKVTCKDVTISYE